MSTGIHVLRRAAAAVLALLTALALPPFSVGAAHASGTAGSGSRMVEDAVLEWAVNAESGGGAFMPGTCNFLSAGAAGSSGSSRTWKQEDGLYANRDGAVSILRPVEGEEDRLADWDSKCLDPAGARVTTAAGSTSGNYVRITGGEGTIDPKTDTGTIRWTGSFTLVYYSGLTYWSVSDPTLVVENGVGRLQGTFSGYGADMNDTTQWNRLPQVEGVLADFAQVDLTEDGFTVTPDYLGVEAKVEDQQRTGKHWGAFPASWVDYSRGTGQFGYWHSTGGAADPKKPAAPVTIGHTLGEATAPEELPARPDDDTDAGPAPTAPSTPAEPGDPGEDSADTADPAELAGTDSSTLYWGVNQESSGGAPMPGTCNFLSAGVAGDAGSSRTWREADGLYRAESVSTRVEKPGADGSFAPASWDTKCSDRTGAPVTTRPGSHSETRVAISSGEVESADESGIEVSWTGGFTIVYYTGLTYWSISDPELSIDSSGAGELRGTASGYGSDREDTSRWVELAPTEITLATFDGVDVAEAVAAGGFTVTPDYLGVESGTDDQYREGDSWGSFPRSWVEFAQLTGQGSYWYSSGGAADRKKVAAPLTVAFSEDFAPSGAEYAGAPGSGSGAASSAAGGATGSGGAPADGSTGPQPGSGQQPAPQPDSADHTVFAEDAAAARADDELLPAGWRPWAVGGSVLALLAAMSVISGWAVRRHLGLDPHTWT